MGIISEQVFESYLFLESAIKKARKEGKELRLRFNRFGPLNTEEKDGNNTCRTETKLKHATDGRDEGADGKRLLDGRESFS